MFTLNVQLPLHSSLRQVFALYTACATFGYFRPKLSLSISLPKFIMIRRNKVNDYGDRETGRPWHLTF